MTKTNKQILNYLKSALNYAEGELELERKNSSFENNYYEGMAYGKVRQLEDIIEFIEEKEKI